MELHAPQKSKFLWRIWPHAPQKYNLVATYLWRIPLFPGYATEIQKGVPQIALFLVVLLWLAHIICACISLSVSRL